MELKNGSEEERVKNIVRTNLEFYMNYFYYFLLFLIIVLFFITRNYFSCSVLNLFSRGYLIVQLEFGKGKDEQKENENEELKNYYPK